jgi:hypothetical protein
MRLVGAENPFLNLWRCIGEKIVWQNKRVKKQGKVRQWGSQTRSELHYF